MWVINLPIRVPVSKKKQFSLNLNQYRNAHFITLNNAKVAFAEIVTPRITHLPAMQKVRISYHLFMGTNHLSDVANICSIVDKFFCDTLVSSKKLPDDNYNHLFMVAYGFGGVDKSDPRVEAFIEPM